VVVAVVVVVVVVAGLHGGTRRWLWHSWNVFTDRRRKKKCAKKATTKIQLKKSIRH
jgi:hypothetical protein